MRQAAILLTVYLEPPPHTVRGLAARLGVTKPVITRALDTMGALKLVSRHRDEQRQAQRACERTVEGALFVERLGDADHRQGAGADHLTALRSASPCLSARPRRRAPAGRGDCCGFVSGRPARIAVAVADI